MASINDIVLTVDIKINDNNTFMQAVVITANKIHDLYKDNKDITFSDLDLVSTLKANGIDLDIYIKQEQICPACHKPMEHLNTKYSMIDVFRCHACKFDLERERHYCERCGDTLEFVNGLWKCSNCFESVDDGD